MKRLLTCLLLLLILGSINAPSSVSGISKKYKGKGDLKISKNVADVLEYYFSRGKLGRYAKEQKTAWVPFFFVISPDGKHFRYYVNSHGGAYDPNPNYIGQARSKCKKKSGQECFVFANGYSIVWDNGTDKKKRRLKKKDIKAGKTLQILQELGFYDAGTTTIAKKEPKKEKKKEKKEPKKKIVKLSKIPKLLYPANAKKKAEWNKYINDKYPYKVWSEIRTKDKYGYNYQWAASNTFEKAFNLSMMQCDKRRKNNSSRYKNSEICVVLYLNGSTETTDDQKIEFAEKYYDKRLVYNSFDLNKHILQNPKILVAKKKTTETQKIVKISGLYKGNTISSKGVRPLALELKTNNKGEVSGNYTYGSGEQLYGGPLYNGELHDGILKIFWTEGETKGWLEIKFDEKFENLKGDWGFLNGEKEDGMWVASKETTITQQKAKKETKSTQQEEIKISTKKSDTTGPKIEIAEAITVKNKSYTLEGKVSDQGSDKIYIDVEGQNFPVKRGKFKIKRYSPVDEEVKIVAIDQWGNRSVKVVKVSLDIKEETVAQTLEPLNPSRIKNKTSGEKVALIIGIENYAEAPKANYANLDAKYFFDYARKAFGAKKQNINLLINEEATFVKTNIVLTKWLRSRIKADQTDLIVFFAGHGLASNDGKELYLLSQDSDPDLLSRTALSRTELFAEIISLKPKTVTMFLDTCYSGVSRDEQMLLASARPIRIVASDEGEIPNNFTIFSASQLDQVSSGLKEAKHGIFSYYLMKGLEGKADADKNKEITNRELLAYMDQNISQKASELGRSQNPSLSGDPDQVLMKY